MNILYNCTETRFKKRPTRITHIDPNPPCCSIYSVFYCAQYLILSFVLLSTLKFGIPSRWTHSLAAVDVHYEPYQFFMI